MGKNWENKSGGNQEEILGGKIGWVLWSENRKPNPAFLNVYTLCVIAKLFPEYDGTTGLGRSISRASLKTSSMVSTGTN